MPPDSKLPAQAIQAGLSDPAAGTPAPPNFGQEIVPHIHTISGRYGVASHSYLNMDEATQDSQANAERMRVDCGIMECVEQRQRAVALLPWHIECDDDKDPEQQEISSTLTSILEETPRFVEYRRSLLESIWYGRYAIANQFGAETVRGQWRRVVKRWEPRHGDKLVFRYDDGNHEYMNDQVGIRVSTVFQTKYRHSDQHRHRKITPTQHGLVYWLDDWERKTMCVHKHMVEDGPFYEPRKAGRIHGVGIRDRIYWTWYAMIECLQRVIEYLDRAAFGVEIWPYEANNARAKTETEEAAFQTLGGGRTVILAPIPRGEDAAKYFPHRMEPGLGGVESVINIIRTYFGHKIKRYILGQTLSSEAEATGLGSGVSDAHLATLGDILAYDAQNLEETITRDLLRPLMQWNFPNLVHLRPKFRINTESDNSREKLEAVAKAWEIGLRIKADDVYGLVGMSRPDMDDETLSNPKIAQEAAAAGMQADGSGNTLLSPEAFEQSFMQSMMQQTGPQLA